MSITSKDPDPGGQSRVTRWLYTPLKGGGQTVGFLGGPPVGVWCHWMGASKPCRDRMSDRALSCPLCAAGLPAVWRGYTPYYSREYTRMMAIITPEYLDSVREIAPHAQVVLSRAKDTRAPLVFRAENWRTLALPPGSGRDWPADVLSYLLRLWGDADLARWHAESATAPPPTAADVPAAVARRSASVLTPDQERRLIRDALGPVSGGDGAAGGMEGIGDVLGRVPSANGRHKKPK